MQIRVWRFVAILLAALSLSLTSAHVLELPQKMVYDAQMYAAVNTTLYRYFAIVGGVYTVGAIVAALVLTCQVRRHRSSFRWTLAGAFCLLLAFATWLVIVAPVNSTIADALRVAPQSVPTLWMELRARWEYGHAVGFIITLIGFGTLLMSTLVDTAQEDPPRSNDWQ